MKQYAWLILVVAGVFETGWAVGLKFTQGLRGWAGRLPRA